MYDMLSDEQLRKHIDFEHVIANLSQSFINLSSDRLSDSIIAAMELICKNCRFERSSIWRYHWEKGTMKCLYVWSDQPDSLRGGDQKVIPLSVVSEALDYHVQGKPFIVRRSDDLPANSLYRKLMMETSVMSSFSYPLTAYGKVIGEINYSTLQRQMDWDERDLAAVELFCPMLTSVLLRMEQEQTLHELMREATRKVEYEARLKVVTDFYTNISHEFKTPLSIILMDIDLVDTRLKSVEFENKEKVIKGMAVMRQNAHRLLRLVGNLLDVTKLDAGFVKVWFQDTDVAQWLGKLIESVEDYAANRGIKVCFIDDCEIHSMPIDGEKLDRIMLNLLSNAIKHTPAGGHISVTLSDTVNKILIAVKDDGEGIPEDKKDLIFDRFKQVDSALTRPSEGSGIGLALTKSLVELLHGRIWFESWHGKGTVFYVELPVLQLNGDGKMMQVDGLTLNRKVEMEFSDII